MPQLYPLVPNNPTPIFKSKYMSIFHQALISCLYNNTSCSHSLWFILRERGATYIFYRHHPTIYCTLLFWIATHHVNAWDFFLWERERWWSKLKKGKQEAMEGRGYEDGWWQQIIIMWKWDVREDRCGVVQNHTCHSPYLHVYTSREKVPALRVEPYIFKYVNITHIEYY